MNRIVPSTVEMGLLATGSSAHWSIDIDRSFDGEELNMQISSATLYFAFQLSDVNVASSMTEYLRQGSLADNADHDLPIGRFGTSTVSLRWDNEDFPRCFLVVGSNGQSTMHFSFYENDIKELVEILNQILLDL